MDKKKDFTAIFKTNYPKVIRLCLGYTEGREDQAKDLAQEVFLKVWQSLESFRGDASIGTWIYRITVNVCLQEIRRREVTHIKIDTAVDQTISSEEKEQQFTTMYRCIDRLPPENKTIILLELEGVPQSEIAEITGISHQAVRTRIHRIKEQLSKCVRNE
ncbi:sigma-70 family RNA polymerase sigma factor [Flavobacterium rakeshii]|uniref:Sigma-70 family RNA polymerase sigma factor n=2 Tax=Flavobacterium TaxID=237 RepID=A0A6N8HG61_9FLAO|nr:sigma-70 family RNA polymerase sigma factor [Flavobacterium rakeshii]MUV04693.1 sigma-70 family RNA polymerase sigma factor [Flavobacterium rakeshii]